VYTIQFSSLSLGRKPAGSHRTGDFRLAPRSKVPGRPSRGLLVVVTSATWRQICLTHHQDLKRQYRASRYAPPNPRGEGLPTAGFQTWGERVKASGHVHRGAIIRFARLTSMDRLTWSDVLRFFFRDRACLGGVFSRAIKASAVLFDSLTRSFFSSRSGSPSQLALVYRY